MKKKCLFIDVFTDQRYAGNQLAIFPDADDLSPEQMQKLANEINYSETTFILKTKDPNVDFDIRIFTVSRELPFAGHPTLGTAYAIMELIENPYKGKNNLKLKTKVGVIPLEKNNGSIWMTQNSPEFSSRYTDKSTIAELITLSPEDISDDLPIEEVSTGNTMLIIPIKNLSAIQRAAGNAGALRRFVKEKKCIGPYLFTLDTTNMSARVHTRFFAPHIGVPEDAATGSAAGPLVGYLLKHDVFGHSFEIENEQGIEMGRPSKIMMRGMKHNNTYTIEIGGQSAYVGTGEFVI